MAAPKSLSINAMAKLNQPTENSARYATRAQPQTPRQAPQTPRNTNTTNTANTANATNTNTNVNTNSNTHATLTLNTNTTADKVPLQAFNPKSVKKRRTKITIGDKANPTDRVTPGSKAKKKKKQKSSGCFPFL